MKAREAEERRVAEELKKKHEDERKALEDKRKVRGKVQGNFLGEVLSTLELLSSLLFCVSSLLLLLFSFYFSALGLLSSLLRL